MTIKKFINWTLLFSILAAATPTTLFAQRTGDAAPKQEKLLNGLKVLVWNVPSAEKVSLKLRIHGGSAFDPQDREGVMRLLSDSFFPNTAAREYFTDELGGDLEIICNYDYIQINASARSEGFVPMLETISTAIANPVLDKEATASLKAALIAKVKELESDPSYIADRAAAKRLFGTFPYGRPQLGSVESIEKIDFADLRFAKDRLLTADNATIAISGGVDPALAMRAARRYFGAWLKADKTVPATFRQPDSPEPARLDLKRPGLANSEIRYAIRGFARSSKDFAAAEIYSRILQTRFRDLVSKGAGADAAVSHDEHILPGAFLFRYRSQPIPVLLPSLTGNGVSGSVSLLTSFGQQATDAEFSAARNETLSVLQSRDMVDWWLDVDTFKITSVASETKAFENVTLADVNALAQRLAREPFAVVALSSGTPAATDKRLNATPTHRQRNCPRKCRPGNVFGHRRKVRSFESRPFRQHRQALAKACSSEARGHIGGRERRRTRRCMRYGRPLPGTAKACKSTSYRNRFLPSDAGDSK